MPRPRALALAALLTLPLLGCKRGPAQSGPVRPTPEELARLSVQAGVEAAAAAPLPDGGAPPRTDPIRYLVVLGQPGGTVPARAACAGSETDLPPGTEVLGAWRVAPGADTPQPVDAGPWKALAGARGTTNTLSLGTHWVWLTCLSPTDATVAQARIVPQGSAGYTFDLRREGAAWKAGPARRTWTR